MLIPTNKLLLAMLDGITQHLVAATQDGPLYHCYVGLYKNVVQPTAQTLLANLTECAYTGYVRKQVTVWTVDFVGQDGKPSIVSLSSLFFQPTGPVVVAELATGYFIADALAAGNLLACENFDGPKSLQVVTDGLDIVARIALDPTAGIGAANVIN